MNLNPVNPTFTPEPGRSWGYWSDPDVFQVYGDGLYRVAAEDNPAGRQLAIEAITDALLYGRAEQR